MDASRARDAKGLARAAHTLKSSSAQVGAESLAGICKELEACARSGELRGIEERIHAVAEELGRVREALAIERLGARDD